MYCPDIRNGLYVTKSSESGVNLGFCCVSGRSNETDTVTMHNSWLIEQRNMPVPTACSYCVNDEANNVPSRRQGIIKFYKSIDKYNTPSTNLINLDYNCENVCNAKCITCSSYFSSQWINDEILLGIVPQYKKTKHNRLLYEIDYSEIQRVHFNGGEPLLTADHLHVLECIISANQSSNCVVSYNTNGSVIPDEDTFKAWEQFKLVKLSFSLDAIGAQFDYIRFPLVWQQVEENLLYWKKFSRFNIMFEVNITAGVHNVLYLPDTVKWLNNNFSENLQTDPVAIIVQPVSHKFLQLNNLPEKFKITASSQLRNLSYPWAESVSKLILQPVTDKWELYLDNLDLIRGNNWRSSLSRLV